MDYKVIEKIHKELDKLPCDSYTLNIVLQDKQAINISKASIEKDKKIGY